MNTTTLATPGRPGHLAGTADAVYRKVSWRLIPLLFLCYIAAYLDRVNVGFAKLQMTSALSLSDTVYGAGAGIFFVGYFIFEIPSNLMLHKVGAGKWIARIMVSWGLLSASMMFVNSAVSFYIVRFLLGVAEAGFFPGIILYITYWYPAARRGRATSLFLTAVAVAGIIGGPMSGWILHSLDRVDGLAGWQWLFVLEALPSLVLGVLAWFYLEDRVKNARWLTLEERDLIAREIGAEEAHKSDEPLARVLLNPKVWVMALVYFGIVSGLYGVSFWLPTIIKAMGVSDPLDIGLVSAIPWAFGVVAMYLIARSADRLRESRWHTALPCVLGALGLEISVAFHGDVVLSMAGLTLCTIGIMAALPVSWSNPTAMLAGTAAAAGIALINSVGNLAGFVIPLIIGMIKDRTHSTDLGLHMLAGLMIVAALAVLSLGEDAGAPLRPGRPTGHAARRKPLARRAARDGTMAANSTAARAPTMILALPESPAAARDADAAPTPVQVLAPRHYQERAVAAFEDMQLLLSAILPAARVEHVGASAIPGAYSTGGVDLVVAVPPDGFHEALGVLGEAGFAIRAGAARGDQHCMLDAPAGDIPLAVRLAGTEAAPGAGPVVAFRDALRADPTLLSRYNAIKIEAGPRGELAYGAAKAEFIRGVLATHA